MRLGSARGTALAPTAATDLRYQRPRPNTVVIAGDSITAMNHQTTGTRDTFGGIYYNYARGYWTWASAFLRHRLRLLNNAGVSGETSAQVLARFDNDVIAYQPGYVVLLVGTNDHITGVALATLQANVLAMLDKVDAIGALPVVLTIPPKSNSSATNAQLTVIHGYNYWLKTLSRSRRNLLVVDIHPALSDATTADDYINKSVVQYTADGTHPGPTGAARMGRLIAQALDPLIPKIDLQAFSSAEAVTALMTGMTSPNVVQNPGLTGTAGTVLNGVTGTVATGWSAKALNGAAVAGTVAASKVARTDQVGGDWQQLAVAGAASQVRAYAERVVGDNVWAVGDKVVASCEFQADQDWASVTAFRLAVGCYNASFQNAQAYDMSFTESVAAWPLENHLTSVVLRSPVLTIPTGATGLYFAIDFIGIGTFRFARPELRKNPS